MGARKNRAATKGSMPKVWRERISAAMIAHRLMDHFEGKVELTNTQLKAADLLFKRVEPELTRTELTGKDGGAIEHKNVSDSDREIIDSYIKSKLEQSK